MRALRFLTTAVLSSLLLASTIAHGQDQPTGKPSPTLPKPAEPDTPEVIQARAAFKHGSELVGKAQWAEALAAFEESDKLRHHPVTTYNIGACQRALGHYVLARNILRAALEDNTAKGGKQMPEGLVGEAKAYLDEIERILVRLDVTVNPPDAAITVDGRPLEKSPDKSDKGDIYLAGTLPPGKGEPIPSPHFFVVVDPGAHLFTLSRKGFNDVVINKSYAPAVQEPLKLELNKLPGTIRISSNREQSAVLLSNLDVGLAPVELTRPGGSYDVSVQKEGFVPYRTTVKVNPGEEATLNADLQPEGRPITKEWWFWAGAGAILVGLTVGTYFIAKSDPEPVRPPVDRGGLGWVVTTP